MYVFLIFYCKKSLSLLVPFAPFKYKFSILVALYFLQSQLREFV